MAIVCEKQKISVDNADCGLIVNFAKFSRRHVAAISCKNETISHTQQHSGGWVAFQIAAVTYMCTLEPTASFWDCPEFISQGYKLEIGHPPGNPIFMLTARFFVNFVSDPSQVALAVNTMSGLLSAATILLLFWTITHLVKRLIVKDDATTVLLSRCS